MSSSREFLWLQSTVAGAGPIETVASIPICREDFVNLMVRIERSRQMAVDSEFRVVELTVVGQDTRRSRRLSGSVSQPERSACRDRVSGDEMPGQMNGKPGTRADAAGHIDLTADRLDQMLDDREPQPGPAELAAACFVDAVEPFENAGQVVARDADSGVGDLDPDGVAVSEQQTPTPTLVRECT